MSEQAEAVSAGSTSSTILWREEVARLRLWLQFPVASGTPEQSVGLLRSVSRGAE
jgi:hypothetical protein